MHMTELLQRLRGNRSEVAAGLHDSLPEPSLARSFRITGPYPVSGSLLARKDLFKRAHETVHLRGFFRALRDVKMNEEGMTCQ